MIFKRIGNGRPYPDHGRESTRQWADVAPRPVRLDQLVTTKQQLDLETLLAEDSTFYGDLFAHVVKWQGDLYLEGRPAPARSAPRSSSVRSCTHACSNWTDQ
ncbi:hypothetical protein GCM10020221_35410 [Streptomyces thioluteus]|uniref:Uncharacterized protein n=1 Tax=Streptomyces thioluteus TaxID=66431 RepID=A0ABN3X3N9_STRTU